MEIFFRTCSICWKSLPPDCCKGLKCTKKVATSKKSTRHSAPISMKTGMPVRYIPEPTRTSKGPIKADKVGSGMPQALLISTVWLKFSKCRRPA
eukprot:Skav226919  [mRNA]  locus=scaffold1147:87166:88030:- [translate_table: standard]